MAFSRVAVLSFIVLFATFEIGTSLKCFVCRSDLDPRCGDPFFKDFMKSVVSTDETADCSTRWSDSYYSHLRKYATGETDYCGKIVTRHGDVTRLCLKTSDTKPMRTCEVMTKDSKNKDMYCSLCDKDDCNGVDDVTASFPLIALTIILSYIVYKQY